MYKCNNCLMTEGSLIRSCYCLFCQKCKPQGKCPLCGDDQDKWFSSNQLISLQASSMNQILQQLEFNFTFQRKQNLNLISAYERKIQLLSRQLLLANQDQGNIPTKNVSYSYLQSNSKQQLHKNTEVSQTIQNEANFNFDSIENQFEPIFSLPHQNETNQQDHNFNPFNEDNNSEFGSKQLSYIKETSNQNSPVFSLSKNDDIKFIPQNKWPIQYHSNINNYEQSRTNMQYHTIQIPNNQEISNISKENRKRENFDWQQDLQSFAFSEKNQKKDKQSVKTKNVIVKSRGFNP